MAMLVHQDDAAGVGSSGESTIKKPHRSNSGRTTVVPTALHGCFSILGNCHGRSLSALAPHCSCSNKLTSFLGPGNTTPCPKPYGSLIGSIPVSTNHKTVAVGRKRNAKSLIRCGVSTGSYQLGSLLRPCTRSQFPNPHSPGAAIIVSASHRRRTAIIGNGNRAPLIGLDRVIRGYQGASFLGPRHPAPRPNPKTSYIRIISIRSHNRRVPISRNGYGGALICLAASAGS